MKDHLENNSILVKPTIMAMSIIENFLSPGEAVVDATTGNGHDTLILAKMARQGLVGKVYGFDIQKQAIENTKKLLVEEGCHTDKITLIKDCHSRMNSHIAEEETVCAVLFNLGYLPGADKEITTKTETTCRAVIAALERVKSGGAVVIVTYDGHEAGKLEKKALLSLASDLDPRLYHASYMNMINQKEGCPEVIAITKKRGERSPVK